MGQLSTASLVLLFTLTQFAVTTLAQGSASQISTIAYSYSPTSTSSAAPQTHTITVGNGDHKFRPDVTQAEIGDTIEFDFYPANHSVVRAEYQYPCIPYELTGTDKVGFFSGFHPVDAVLQNPPKWTVVINDTNPIFFYCSAPGACISYGMVGVINPNASTSLEVQHQMALDSAYMLQPGEAFPAEAASSSLSSKPSTPTPSSSALSSTPFLTATPAPATSTTAAAVAAGAFHSGLSTGAIAGIAVGGASVLILAAALFFYIGRSRTLKDEVQRASATIRPLPPQNPSSMYQTPGGTFFVPKNGDGHGTDPSSRNSAVPYDVSPSQVYVREAPRPEVTFGVTTSAEDARSLRSANGSPAGDGGRVVSGGGGVWNGVPLGPYGQQYASVVPNPAVPARNTGNVSPRLPVASPQNQYYDGYNKPPVLPDPREAHEMDAPVPGYVPHQD
ncbi:hypothetical protein K432DRAFT_411133 [Lepidopterella palustris CBS 459.81]|uniref:Extracellular serine-rich protein n=1 Tax=Lepidopterella palustris CBS 459.81 TaxID=1314670 RepID=A0A8E2DWH9_9PEZI|nr:hypothetical protein K432DRAFT_411133 [Lepidopterella palustris CBS 459.81]